MFNEKTKASVFGFTKSKAYGLCGAILAMASISVGGVSADEVSSVSDSGTNAPVSSVVAPEVADGEAALTVNQGNLDLQEFSSRVPLPTDVSEIRKNSPVSVEEKVFAEIWTTEEETAALQSIRDDYAKQVSDAAKITEDYKARVKEYNTATVEARQNNIAKDTGKEIYLTGEVDNTAVGTAGYYGDLSVVVLNDEVSDKNFLSNVDYSASQEVVGDNVEPYTGSNVRATLSDTAKNTVKTVISNVGDGTSFIVKNGAESVSGEYYDVKYTFNNVSYFNGANRANSELYLGENPDGGIDFNFYGINKSNLTVDFLDKSGNVVKTVQSYVVSDLDWGQGVGVSYSDSNADLAMYNPEGSELTLDGGVLYSQNGVGRNGLESTPAGTFVTTGYGSPTYTIDATRDVGGQAGYEISNGTYTISLFNKAGAIKTISKPDKPSYKFTQYKYSKYGVVNVIVKDVNGNVIDKESAKSPVPAGYDTTQTDTNILEINGRKYRLVSVEGDKQGRFKLGEQNIVYTVERLYTTSWVDKDGKELKAPVTDSTTKDKGGFSNYQFVKTTTDKDGNVRHIFERLYTTSWVDKDDKELKAPVIDTTTKDKGDFSNYQFVKTTTDKDGNVKHIFEKKVVPVVSSVPQQPQSGVESKGVVSTPSVEKNYTESTLPNTGDKENILLAIIGLFLAGLSLIGIRKKADEQ